MTTTPHGASALIHDVTPDTAAELDRLAEQREIERRTGPVRAERWLRERVAGWERGYAVPLESVIHNRPDNVQVGHLLDAVLVLVRDETLIKTGQADETALTRKR